MSGPNDTSSPAFPARVTVNRNSGELRPYQTGNNDFYLSGISMRDYFAAHASDADVAAMRDKVPRTDRTTDRNGIVYCASGQEPDNWRTIARYMHAHAMLLERAK